MTDSQQLLAEYARNGSDTAFRDLVSRYLNLVYSTALRLVEGDTHRAEDVAQTVFVDLARKARTLVPEAMVGGWLHRHTCFVAANTLRGERRRLARERQAVEMNALQSDSDADVTMIAPILDEAINELNEADRTAILLRFFEQCDFRVVGELLGSTEDAARMRVARALEKLQALLKRRGVTTTTAGLTVVLATNAVQAAPAGLAVTIATTSALAGTSIAATATATATKAIAMTTLQKTIVTATVVVLAGAGIYQAHQASTLRREVETLRRQQAPVTNELAQLKAENERLSKLVARAGSPPAAANTPPLELLRLRGEVGRLRRELADAAASRSNAPSALSGLTSNPDMWKWIRDQNKTALGAVYKDFAKRANLPKEQAEQLTDLLADNVMDNVDQITAVLREGMSSSQMQSVFAAQEAALLDKVQALLGPDDFAEYRDYTRNLCSQVTAEQFKAKLTGDKAIKEEKAKQLCQAMQEATQRALASAGLSADFQTVPMLNFRNLASEAEAEKSLKLLDDIYGRVATRASVFLSPDEVVKFEEFRKKALDGNRVQLTLNRKLMSPGSK